MESRLGLTDGVRALADDLRTAGHVVHTPDLYEGRTFADIQAGVAYAEDEVRLDTIIGRGVAAAEGLPERLVYGGWHLFCDRTLPDYEPEAAALVKERTLAFLERVGGTG